MELFKFAPGNAASTKLVLTDARVINGLTQVMWVERYRDSGEFTITSPMEAGLREFLPIGSIISTTGTTDLMIVENHNIVDNMETTAEITISGRSYETFLEQRVVSANIAAYSEAQPTYSLAAGRPAAHAAKLIEDHVYLCTPSYTDDAIKNVRAISIVNPAIGENSIREIKIGSVYKAVIELLAQDDLGIRAVRPGPWLDPYQAIATVGQPFYNDDDFGFIIYQGTDRRGQVAFSHTMGEITNAEYLWSSKNEINSVMIQGKYKRFRVPASGAEPSFNRRVAYVDASDIDDKYADLAAANADLVKITAAMTARANEVLSANKGVSIARVEVTQNNPRYRYGIDYNVGDIVGVNGNYDIVGAMRVTEQVTILDEYGYTSYPTLETI